MDEVCNLCIRIIVEDNPISSSPVFKPFEDDSCVVSLGELSVENGLDYILLSGSLEISRDAASLTRLDRLIEILVSIKQRAVTDDA